jgi:hypothetical protein
VQIAFKSIRLDCIIQGHPTTQRVTAEGGGDIKPLRVAGKGLATNLRGWTQMSAYFQPQQSSLNKDASQQYGHEHSRRHREITRPMRENCWPSWRPFRRLLEVAPRILEATDKHDHATNIQPNQRNRPADTPSHCPGHMGLPRNITIGVEVHLCRRHQDSCL